MLFIYLGDDSSDALESEAAKISQNNKSSSSSKAPSEPKNDESKLSKLSAPLLVPAPPVQKQITTPNELDLKNRNMDPIVKIRELIRLEKGTPTIRRSKALSLSVPNRLKIFKQWKNSKKRFFKKYKMHKRSRSSTTSESESSGT